MILTTTDCKHCKVTTFKQLHRQQFNNGSWHYIWVCQGCRHPMASKTGGMFIPHELVMERLTVEELNDLPLLMPDLFNRCVVCGNRHAELHHWGPKYLFGEEAEKWPKDYLCKGCHEFWHTKIKEATHGA